MPVLRAVVFDLDDTLYPERTYVLGGFRAAAVWADKYIGIPPDQGFTELSRLFDEGVRSNTFDCWLKNRRLGPGNWVEELVRVYREHEPQIVPYPGVLDLLRRLRQHFLLGLVTDGYLAVQQRKIASLGLTSCFDALVFSDELGHEAWKPSPQPFEVVLKKLRVTGHEAAYVADNPTKDFLGARQVGMWTIRICAPEGLYSHLEPPSPDYTPDTDIQDLNSLETVLVQIGGYKL